MKSLILSLFLAAIPLTQVARGEDHRELGPHVHGHGILNIAVEATLVSMELDVPGMDIVGFEHAANTPEQQAIVQRAEALLAQPLVIFKVPAAAGCKVVDAKVAIEGEGEHNHDKIPGGEKGEPEPAGHNDYNVSYILDCAKPSEITSIQFDYFTSFPGAKALSVNLVNDKGQNSYEVAREKPMLDLGGLM